MGELLVLAGIGEYILIQSRKLQAIQKKKNHRKNNKKDANAKEKKKR